MIRAIYDRVIVEVEYQEISRGGIIIADGAKSQHGDFWGIVASIGPDYPHKDVKVDDKVHFPRSEGWKMEDKGRTYYCLRARWVFAVEN